MEMISIWVLQNREPGRAEPDRSVASAFRSETFRMTSRLTTLALACSATVAVLANTAHADRGAYYRLDDPYLAAKVTLGIGGSVSATTDTPGDDATSTSDLEPSFGVAVQYMAPLHRYFTLGGLLGVSTWQSKAGSDADSDRNIAVDLAVVPQLRFALDRELELYISVPVGITLDFLNAVYAEGGNSVAAAKIDADPALGLVISPMVGLRWLVTRHVGLFTEVSLIHRQFTHAVKGSVSVVGIGASTSVDVAFALNQFAWNIGVTF
jgi:hypothetical protein